MDVLVARPAQADEVVVLGHDLAGRPGEVDLEDRHVAAEVGDVEDQVVGQVLGVAPQHPAHPERGQAELVARGADRLDPGDAEVPHHVGGAEGGEEGAAGTVDVDVDVEAGVLGQLVERLATARAPARRSRCRSPRRSGTTMMVFSSTCSSICSTSMQ